MNYQNGKIYRLISYNTMRQYIGSTCQPLSKRLSQHVNYKKRFENGKQNYVSSFDILIDGNYKIELIENFSCETKEELEKQEGIHIRNEECVNKRIAGRTKTEYQLENKEYIINQRKEFRTMNKEKITEQKKQYYIINKDKVLENQKQLVVCECGTELAKTHISRHKKTNKHIKSMAKLNLNI
jgi:glucosamine 6-phosphate synthetase-like amidotransferase/phosphosugar isomerase protein